MSERIEPMVNREKCQCGHRQNAHTFMGLCCWPGCPCDKFEGGDDESR